MMAALRRLSGFSFPLMLWNLFVAFLALLSARQQRDWATHNATLQANPAILTDAQWHAATTYSFGLHDDFQNCKKNQVVTEPIQITTLNAATEPAPVS